MMNKIKSYTLCSYLYKTCLQANFILYFIDFIQHNLGNNNNNNVLHNII